MDYQSYCHDGTQIVVGRVGPLEDTLLTLQTRHNQASPWIIDYMDYKSCCHGGSPVVAGRVGPLQDTLLTLQAKDNQAAA